MAVLVQSIIDSINYRIHQEEYSSRLYLAMSVWLDKNGYTGAAKLWKQYSIEEQGHAEWAYRYLLDLDILPDVPAFKRPQVEFKGLPNIIALSLKHELDITRQCQELGSLSKDNNDWMTLELAQKYLKEQVDEIAKITTWVDKLEAFGESKEALRLLDNEMGCLVG